ncbi:MAG: TolC family protein [Spirochaetales bacterium]|nr:TolC family protein [Spirochaetales bacterium]
MNINRTYNQNPVILVLYLVLCLIGIHAAAQEQTPVIMSLEECIETGLKNNTAFLSAKLKTAGLAAHADAMRFQMIPSLTLTGSYFRLSEMDAASIGPVTLDPPLTNSTSFKLGLQQPLFTGFRISSSIQQAEASYRAGLKETEKSTKELIFSIETAYWNVTRARETLKVIEENILQMEAHLQDVTNMFDKGLVTKNEVLSAEMHVSNTRLLKLDAENGLNLARARLNILIGRDWDAAIDTEVFAAQGSDLNNRVPDVQESVKKALENRPEILEMTQKVMASEAAEGLARSGLYPSVFLSGNLTIADPSQRAFPQKDEFTTTWEAGVFLTMDVGRIPQVLAQVSETESQAGQLRNTLAQLREALTLETVQVCLDLKKAGEKVTAAQLFVHQAEENSKNATERYQNGIALNSERMDADLVLLQARLNYTQALIDLKIAEAAYMKAVGD